MDNIAAKYSSLTTPDRADRARKAWELYRTAHGGQIQDLITDLLHLADVDEIPGGPPVATTRLSDTMITAMLDTLRHRRTDDGRYETFAPVRTRDALVARGKVVRTQEYRDNNGDKVVRWYLTEDGITYLRNALEYVLNQRGEERDAVWQEWLNAERRNQWAVIDFLGLTADSYKLTTTEPHSIHQDTETLSRADAWERMGNAMTNGQRITLDDGALTVHTKLGARWTFTPQGDPSGRQRMAFGDRG